MLPCFYSPAQHEILHEPTILDWCRRQTSDLPLQKQLFIYRHRIHSTFVIARWVREPKGIFTDLLNLGHSLGNFTREKAQEFRGRILAPIPVETFSRTINQASRDFASEQHEKGEEMKEIMELRKSRL